MALFWQEANYPWPVETKTKTRCAYHMYNCRALGKYVLDGEGYCAAHYDAVWQWRNPILGTQHDWVPAMRPVGVTATKLYECCSVCGTTKHLQGIAQGPCRGGQARIVLMEEA